MGDDTAFGVRPNSPAVVRALGLLYIAGPTVAVVCLLLPHSATTDETAIWIMAAAAYAMVPVLFTQYSRLPPRAISFVIAFANTLVTAVVFFNHEATSSYAFFYLWVTPYAALFFGLRHAVVHVIYAVGAYAAILAVHVSDGHRAPGHAEVSQWLQPTSALLVTMLLVSALTRALRENVAREDQLRRKHAIEINDDVVQRLVIARQSYDADDAEAGEVALANALERARRIMADLLDDEPIVPGSLRRERPAD